MTSSATSHEEQKVIEIVWSHFKQHLKWPTRRLVIRACDQEGFDFESDGMMSICDSRSEVSLPFDTILERPGVRALLEPVPALLRIGAERFISQRERWNTTTPPAITHEDFERFWPDPSQRALARALFDMGPWRLGGGSRSGPDTYSYYCSIEALRYEKVRTLDEARTKHRHSTPFQKGQSPSGPHLQLLQAIYQHAMRHGEWPVALPFAVEHRNLGFVKDLAEDLHRPYLDEGFGESKHTRLILTIWALPVVDHTGETRATFVEIVNALRRIWKHAPGDEDKVSISLADLSKALDAQPSLVLQAALFIQSERLWRGGNFSEGPSEWSISIDEEAIIRQPITTWDDYLAARRRQYHDPDPIWMREEPVRLKEPVLTGSNVEQEESQDVDVVIVCALHNPELDKVKAVGNARWEEIPPNRTDPHLYYKTLYTTKKGAVLRVVASAPNTMGSAATTVLATKMIMRFRPRLVAMVGIAAGSNPETQEFGDILAANHTFDYDAGKNVEIDGRIEFQPNSSPIAIDTRSATLLKAWENQGTEFDEISRAWPGERPRTRLSLHVGPIGSGAAVVSSRQPVIEVIKHWRKLVGLEMEAHAVHVACRDTITPAPKFLCFKSISDFAEKKDDRWQKYAAYTAAECCYRFLIREWEKLHPTEG
jgi:nucleoside phosphorylase